MTSDLAAPPQGVVVALAPPESGFTVRIAGRPMRTPAGQPLTLPSRALAMLVVEEGASPKQRPIFQLAALALDRIAPDPARAVADLAAYGGAELLCYQRDDALTPGLAAAQRAAWTPWLDWAAQTLGVRLRVESGGLTPISQPPQSLAALHAAVAAHDVFALAALQRFVTATGSLVLGLAVSHGALAVADAARLGDLEIDHQAQRWGEDAEMARRRRALLGWMTAAARFLAAVREQQS